MIDQAMRIMTLWLGITGLSGCSAEWIAPINTSTSACDITDPWSCPAPLTCVQGWCLRTSALRCGDGIVQQDIGEECDDANGDPYDRCNACRVTFCGDGVVQRQTGEICDDGNRQDTDGCTSACVWSRCGDGIQRLDTAPGSTDHEECDDGNDNDRDLCSNACETAKCGDGWVLEGKEVCDDGNDIDDDQCSNTCGLGMETIVLTSLGGCGITERDQLRCWGWGILGDLSTDPPQTTKRPTPVPGVPAVKRLTTHSGQICAVTEDGDLWCWGPGSESRPRLTRSIDPSLNVELFKGDFLTFGPGNILTRLSQTSPDAWTFGADRPVQIAKSFRHFCLRTQQGRVYCMGEANLGVLGFDDNLREYWSKRALPIENAVDLAVNENHNCALKADGRVVCWGNSSSVISGLTPGRYIEIEGLTNIRTIWSGPTTGAFLNAQSLGGTVFKVDESGTHRVGTLDPIVVASATGRNDQCVVLANRRMWCWGVDRESVRLPVADFAFRTLPHRVEGVTNAKQVAVARNHSCALLRDGSVGCWGLDYGRGSGANLDFNAPPSPAYEVESGSMITASGSGSCILDSAQRAVCWGLTSTLSGFSPVPQTLFANQTWRQMNLAFAHGCGITAEQRVKCWGQNTYGSLGDGTTTNSSTPKEVIGLGEVEQIGGGGETHCAIDRSGDVWCWGKNYGGFIDPAGPEILMEAVAVANLPPAQQVSIEDTCACILSDQNEIICWGSPWCQAPLNRSDPSNESRQPIKALRDRPARVIAAVQFACAQLENGAVDCWGRNSTGQLGNGTTNSEHRASAVRDLPRILTMDAYIHACAVSTDHSVYCWGFNRYNQLGDGKGKSCATPTLAPLF
jgi:cysteine-rich repeat protein